jgi:methyltransferase OMS1, mitochondrial
MSQDEVFSNAMAKVRAAGHVGDAVALPFADEQFDTVVDTFSLCVYADPAAALGEMARVVRRAPLLLLVFG